MATVVAREGVLHTRHLVVVGDSADMSRVSDRSVHLIVTSPPYFDARDYATESQLGHGGTLEEYTEGLAAVFRECYRVLQPARRLCLNISDLPISGASGVEWVPLGAIATNVALGVGFGLADRIVWDKTPKKGFQFGSLPYPPSPLICDSMEYVLIFRKPGRPDYAYLDPGLKERSRLSPDEYKEFTKQIWVLPRVRLRDNMDGHIAPFPLDIPMRCIRLYSFVGDTVLDPFAGSGTTGAAALAAQRNSIMYEINRDYVRFIRGKLEGEPGLYTAASITYVEAAEETEVAVGGRR